MTLAAFGAGASADRRAGGGADGAAAYRAELAADARARQSWGTLLLRSHDVHFAATARAALAAGEVDSRPLSMLATLAHVRLPTSPALGDSGPGASAWVLLRSADIAGAAPRGGATRRRCTACASSCAPSGCPTCPCPSKPSTLRS